MSHLVQRISVFMMAASAIFAQTTPTPPTPPSETRTSGIVGIALGQTARFNVLNVAPAATAATSAPIACSAVLTYYDAAGALLKTATVSVAPGTAGYLDLFSDADLSIAVDARRQIRATFSTLAVPPAASSSTVVAAPGCRLIGTLEILDSVSGRVEVVLGGMHRVEPVEPAPAAKQ